MAAVGPVTLAEVRRVLLPRLSQLDREPPKPRYGRVFVATPDALRGRAFGVVFVPGLAERVFPQRAARIRCCSTRRAARSIAALADGGRPRRRRAPAAAPRRRRRDASAAGSRIRASTSGRRGRACRRSTRSTSCARRAAMLPDHVKLRARDGGRDRRLAAGRRPTIRRGRSTTGSTTWPCSAASCSARPDRRRRARRTTCWLQTRRCARSLRTRWARWKQVVVDVGRPDRRQRGGRRRSSPTSG